MTEKKKDNDTTDFGFEQVPAETKANRVAAVFDSVVDRYDLMNDLMSAGIHRLWKRLTAGQTGLRPGQSALDVAAGTGDLALRLSRQVGPTGHVVLSDINHAMLEYGRGRMVDSGVTGNVAYVLADAQTLPFADSTFDCVTIGFGLRNVTDKDAALRSMLRVLKPGGRVLILEFSHLTIEALRPLYDFYSFRVMPLMGRLVASDARSYQYLAESIRMHPNQEDLQRMMEAAGFENCSYLNLSGGVAALHRGYRF